SHRGRKRAPTILLVQGNEVESARLRHEMEAAGYTVDQVAPGGAAIDRVRSAPPGLIIADLAEGVADATELCRAVKAADATRRTPVVMLTSTETREGPQQALEAGADDLLTRPIDHTELVARVQSLLRLKEISDRLAES